MNELTLREGPFALIDCLGFKGIWQKYDPDSLLEKYSKIDQVVRDEINSKQHVFGKVPVRVHVQLMSDTVAISTQFESPPTIKSIVNPDSYLMTLHCLIIIAIMDLFIQEEPALILRGCITYGKHNSQRNFIVGPAVDTAAEYMNMAAGAFVWLLPSASEKLQPLVGGNDLRIEAKSASKEPPMIDRCKTIGDSLTGVLQALLKAPLIIPDYPMPLKGGEMLKCSVLNPFLLSNSEDNDANILSRYNGFMSQSSDRIDILIKRQNTMDFLRCASDRNRLFRSDIAQARSSSGMTDAEWSELKSSLLKRSPPSITESSANETNEMDQPHQLHEAT